MMFREEKKSFFGKMSQRIGDALAGKATIDDDFMDELEEILITSDIGMETTMKIVDMLRTALRFSDRAPLRPCWPLPQPSALQTAWIFSSP